MTEPTTTRKAVEVLDFASLFLYVAKPQDIEHERKTREQEHGFPLVVYSVEHPTFSGARCTRVTWARP